MKKLTLATIVLTAASVATCGYVALATEPAHVRVDRRAAPATGQREQRYAAPAASEAPCVASEAPSAPAAELRRVIRGRVVSEREPVAHAYVTALDAGRVVARARTGRDGEFALDAPLGRFDIEIRHHAHASLRMTGYEPASQGEIFELDPSRGIAGTVRDESGAPVADAIIQVWADDKRAARIFADSNGAFSLDQVGDATLELQVVESAAGHRRGQRIAVVAGDRTIAMQVEQGYTIAGAFERPAPRGAWLEAVDPTGAVVLRKLVRAGQTDFSIKGLGEGRHIVRLYEVGRVVAEHTVESGAASVDL
ncbi:MAG: carboxypeptidase-like regulatory domain-containing protein [Planctomycetota bacterium]|jgi:hypothetical protein